MEAIHLELFRLRGTESGSCTSPCLNTIITFFLLLQKTSVATPHHVLKGCDQLLWMVPVISPETILVSGFRYIEGSLSGGLELEMGWSFRKWDF